MYRLTVSRKRGNTNKEKATKVKDLDTCSNNVLSYHKCRDIRDNPRVNHSENPIRDRKSHS